MFKNMFDNIGTSLEKTGKFIFFFFLITGVLYPVAMLLLDVCGELWELFIGSVILIPSAFLWGLPLCGLGRLITNTEPK